MKLLFDYIPLILFFAVFKLAGANPEAAHLFANTHFAWLVASGVISTTIAPVMLATFATISGGFLQVAYLLARRQKIDTMLMVTLAIVTVLGGATIYFNNEAFILWKPTVLYWFFSGTFLFSDLVLKRNLTRLAVDKLFDAPDALWRRLNYAWVAFFVGLGALNLYVAFNFTLDQWVNFKLFGATGLTFVMFIIQTVPLMKYMKDVE
jgi:intracellular septation protein